MKNYLLFISNNKTKLRNAFTNTILTDIKLREA